MRFALALEGADAPGRAVHDRDGRMPGRGAYLCRGGDPDAPDGACLQQAVRRGAIARTLRAAATLDPKLVESLSR